MDVANDKIVAPSLYDLIAPPRSPDPPAGPSFRDCLQPSPSPRKADSPASSSQPTTRAPDPQPTRADNDAHPDDSAPAAASSPADKNEESAKAHSEEHDSNKHKPKSGDEELAAAEAAAAGAKLALPDKTPASTENKVDPVGSPARPAQPSSTKEKATELLEAQITATTATDGQAAEAIGEAVPADAGTAALLNAEAIQTQTKAEGQNKTDSTPGKVNRPVAKKAAAELPEANTGKKTESTEKLPEHAAEKHEVEVPQEHDDLPLEEMPHASERRTPENNAPSIDAAAPMVDATAIQTAATDASLQATGGSSGQDNPQPGANSNVPPAHDANARPPAALLKAKTGHTEPAARTGEVDPARFLHRVVKAFESAQQRDSEVKLRLHPAELGSLSIEVRVHEGVLSARLQVETNDARTALVDNLPALRERLAEQGIRIEEFDVDLQDHSQHQQQSLREQFQEREGQQDQSALRSANRRAVPQRENSSTSNRAAGPGGLNVVI